MLLGCSRLVPIAAIEPPEVAEVARVAGEREAGKIVVGLPVYLSGEDSGQTALTRMPSPATARDSLIVNAFRAALLTP